MGKQKMKASQLPSLPPSSSQALLCVVYLYSDSTDTYKRWMVSVPLYPANGYREMVFVSGEIVKNAHQFPRAQVGVSFQRAEIIRLL